MTIYYKKMKFAWTPSRNLSEISNLRTYLLHFSMVWTRGFPFWRFELTSEGLRCFGGLSVLWWFDLRVGLLVLRLVLIRMKSRRDLLVSWRLELWWLILHLLLRNLLCFDR